MNEEKRKNIESMRKAWQLFEKSESIRSISNEINIARPYLSYIFKYTTKEMFDSKFIDIENIKNELIKKHEKEIKEIKNKIEKEIEDHYYSVDEFNHESKERLFFGFACGITLSIIFFKWEFIWHLIS